MAIHLVAEPGELNRFVVRVDKRYKGSVSRLVDVISHQQGSMCGGTRLAQGGPPVTTTTPTCATP